MSRNPNQSERTPKTDARNSPFAVLLSRTSPCAHTPREGPCVYLQPQVRITGPQVPSSHATLGHPGRPRPAELIAPTPNARATKRRPTGTARPFSLARGHTSTSPVAGVSRGGSSHAPSSDPHIPADAHPPTDISPTGAPKPHPQPARLTHTSNTDQPARAGGPLAERSAILNRKIERYGIPTGAIDRGSLTEIRPNTRHPAPPSPTTTRR